MKDVVESIGNIRWLGGYDVKINDQWLQDLKSEAQYIQCAKCKKDVDSKYLTELFGWGEYVCTHCIEDWLGK